MHSTKGVALTRCISYYAGMKHDAVIELWPTAEALAEDISTSVNTVRGWKRRRSIPVWDWSRVIAAAERRGLTLTVEMLASGAPVRARAA